MINVSTATKNAYLNHSASNQLSIYFPNLNLTLTNSDIVSESMNLSQIIESESVLTFKGCNASKFEIELVDLERDVRGQRIVVSIQPGMNTDSIVLFEGTIDDQNNINHEDITVKITAYDDLYSVSQNDVTDWYANLIFPMTVKQFRDSFFNHINIAQETVTLPCDDLQMVRMVSSDVALDALKVMRDICQANARFGQLRRGFFTYVALTDTTETAISKNTYDNVDYDPYMMETITKVSVTDDSGATEESYGSGTNVLKIEGNIVAYSIDRAECAERIYDEVSGITMNSARVDLIGLPYLECGDYITLSTSKNDLEMYILNRTLKGIQALTDNYSSTIDKYQHEVNSVESQLITRDGRMNHFYRDLDQTKSTVANNKTDADGKFLQQQTSITQNADSISAEILRAQSAESTLSNTITATADALTVQIEEIYAELDGEIAVYYREGEPTLLNYPAWDFTYNIPCNNTVQTTNDLTFLYTDEYYQQNIRDLVYDTESNLTYRFEKENGTYYWKPIAQSDFSVAMQKIADLEVTTDQISASVSATTLELHSDYYTKTETEGRLTVTANGVLSTVSQNYTNSTDLATNYTSKTTFNQTVNSITTEVNTKVNNTTFNSTVTQLSNSINAKVSTTDYNAEVAILESGINSKVSKGAVSSEISQEAGQVSVSSNRLIVNSSYFTLDANGKGTLGGLSFDQYGFYSEYSGDKVLRVYPNPENGFALTVGEGVYRIIGYQLVGDQSNFSIGHEGEVYVTHLNVLNEYDNHNNILDRGQLFVDDAITINGGNLYVNRRVESGQWVGGQIFASDYIQCVGNIEAYPGSIYARRSTGGTGNVIADSYISATGDNGGSGDIEAYHDLIYGNACYQSSDERLKKDIQDLEDSEKFIYGLRPVSYRLIDNDEKLHRGFIAQEVEELVEGDSAIVGENSRTKYKTLAYTEIIADLVKTVQLQNERIKALEEKIAGLEEKI